MLECSHPDRGTPFYSYDWIENLLGLKIQSSERVIPELQSLQVGDLIPLAPDGFGIPVALLEANRTLVLLGDTRLDQAAKGMAVGRRLSTDHLGLVSAGLDLRHTRLVERFRADWSPSFANQLLMRCLMEPGSFIMERKMLLGIKERAEHRAPGYIELS